MCKRGLLTVTMEIYTIYDAFNEYLSYKTNETKLVVFLFENEKMKYQYEFFSNADNELIYNTILTLLYLVGADKIVFNGDIESYEFVKEKFEKSYDYVFYKNIFPNFSLKYVKYPLTNKIEVDKVDIEIKNTNKTIGIDVGGSDIKVVCLDGEKLLYSNEIIWHPKLNENLNYHINMINSIFDTALSYLNNDVDNIKISSAGVIKDNKIILANLFEKVDRSIHLDDINNFYVNAVKRLENRLNKKINYIVLNDGDVSSIAGMNHYKLDNVLGLALGTSFASGYVNNNKVYPYLNELSSIPFDINNESTVFDYLSQEGVIRYAKLFNISFDKNLSKAEKLKVVQELFNQGNYSAKKVFYEIGSLLASFINYISNFIIVNNVILQGRVLSDNSGKYLYEVCKEKVHDNLNVFLPEESFVRLGQAYTVSLINIKDC